MIKAKTGCCIDCPAGSREVPLIAKRCQTHYWQNNQKVNSEKPKNKAKKVAKKVTGAFIASQTLVMPERCEECGNRLPTSPDWLRRACIAHILPKRPDFGFPSVAIHPLNKMFFCPDCHTNMDNLGEMVIVKMKSLPIMKSRVAQLIPLLTPAETNRVPEYFLNHG